MRGGGRLFLLLLVGTLGVSACGGSDRSASADRSSQTEPGRSKPAGELVYLVPTDVPEGLEMTMTFLVEAREEPAAYLAKLGRPEADAFTSIVSVLLQRKGADREVGPEEETIVIHGAEARVVDHELTGAHVDWFERGLSVAFSGPSGTRDLLVDFAERFEVPESGDVGDVGLPALPEGYEVISEHAAPGSMSRGHYSLVLDDSDRAGPRTLSLSVTSSEEGSLVPATGAVGTDRLWTASLRGAEAVLSSSDHPMLEDFSSMSLGWLEYPDTFVTVQGGGVSEGEIVRFVEGIERVSEEEWRRRVPEPSQD